MKILRYRLMWKSGFMPSIYTMLSRVILNIKHTMLGDEVSPIKYHMYILVYKCALKLRAKLF